MQRRPPANVKKERVKDGRNRILFSHGCFWFFFFKLRWKITIQHRRSTLTQTLTFILESGFVKLAISDNLLPDAIPNEKNKEHKSVSKQLNGRESNNIDMCLSYFYVFHVVWLQHENVLQPLVPV